MAAEGSASLLRERDVVRAGASARGVAAVLLREREAAVILGVSVSQVGAFRRQGLLRVVRIPNIRAARYARTEVEALAQRWIREAGIEEE